VCCQGAVQRPLVEPVDAEEREQAGEFVAVLAEPWDVLVVQQHAQDLGRPDGRGQDVMGLGVFEEGLYPAAVLRRTGTTATGTDRTVLAFLGGAVCPDLLDPQVKAPPGGEVVFSELGRTLEFLPGLQGVSPVLVLVSL
jgi:hypothetical protein